MFKFSSADPKDFPLHATTTSLIMCMIGTDMMNDLGKLRRQFGSNMATFVAFILLLFPSSSSILCIAPGGHIEIEDIRTACCPSADISIPVVYQPDNGFNESDTCQNCEDFFIAANGREAVLRSCDHAVASPFADKCLENRFSADIVLSLCPSNVIKNIDTPIPVSSSLPLLC